MEYALLARQVGRYFEGILTLERLKWEAEKYNNCFRLSHLLKLDYDEFLEGKTYRVHCDVDPELGLHIFTKYFADCITFTKDYNGPLIYCKKAVIFESVKYVNVAPIYTYGRNIQKINNSMLKCLKFYENNICNIIFFLDNPDLPLVRWNEAELTIDRSHTHYDQQLENYTAQEWHDKGLQILHEIYGNVYPKPSWAKKRALQD